MSVILQGLANYGPIGMILLAFLLLFLKLFNRMFDNLLGQQAKSDKFMTSCLEALHELKRNCVQCRNDTVNAAHQAQKAAEERILFGLKQEADRIILDNRRDNDLSRPHDITPLPVRGLPAPAKPRAR
jgi:hypothetical protein